MSTDYQVAESPAWRQNLRPVADPGLGDPGPFYAYTVSVPVGFNQSDCVRAFGADGRLADRIEVGQLYCIRRDHIITDVDRANGKGEEIFEQDVQGSPQKVTNVPTNPADNKRFLTQASMNHLPNQGGSGLVFFEQFKGLPQAVVKPKLFSEILRPVTFTPEYQEANPQVAEQIGKVGALKLYEMMMRDGVKRIQSREFAAEHGPDLQRLYLSVIPTVIAAYRQAERYLVAVVKAEDAYVKQNGAKGAMYSNLAEYCFYMTGRKPETDALTRALGGGLDAGQLEAILNRVAPQKEASEQLLQCQCENCGAMSNRIVETGLPPTLCWQCKKKFPVEETI